MEFSFKKQRNNIILSIFFSVLISFICYLINNCPYPYWDTLDKYSKLEFLLRNLVGNQNDTKDVIFINVAYDKQIAECTYDAISHGQIAVTDRNKLIRFLNVAKKCNYKFIFLDIRFEDNVYTPQDTILSTLIKQMPRLMFSEHSDIITDSLYVSEKAAINDYFTTITSTNFTRYQFLQDDKESAPLRLYLALNPDAKPIKKYGILYTCGGNLCQNSPFMSFPEDFKSTYEGTGAANYFHLGSDLLDPETTEEDIQSELDGKIIILGDFVSDLHDTYAGLQPGSYLVYLAYKELVKGEHLLAWPFIILMSLVYFFISWFIINNKSLWDFLPRINQIKSKILLFIFNLMGYTTILSIITILMYLLFRATYNIFFPTLFFSILCTIKSYKKTL